MSVVKDLDDLERLLAMLERHSIDSLEIEGIKVSKTRFVGGRDELLPSPREAPDTDDEDDALYYAADD